MGQQEDRRPLASSCDVYNLHGTVNLLLTLPLTPSMRRKTHRRKEDKEGRGGRAPAAEHQQEISTTAKLTTNTSISSRSRDFPSTTGEGNE